MPPKKDKESVKESEQKNESVQEPSKIVDDTSNISPNKP